MALMTRLRIWKAAAAATCISAVAIAEDAAPKIDTGDTAWVLISAALVLLMTPGLAFFYGGMVRTKNVLSTLFQNFSALSVVGLLWVVAGYSLAFSTNGNAYLGSLDWFMLDGVGQRPNPDYSATVPHIAFMIFQCMFAVIAPALITGAVAERLNFKAWVAFAAFWSLVVYVPVAHWVWGVGGWIRAHGGLDFAGGLVVHMTAGFSALVAAIMLGRRRDFGTNVRPYDASFVMLGTALLWFGWIGFNAGSALGANGLAAHAFATTFFSAAAAAVSWVLVDVTRMGKPSAIGACIGAVVGLVAVTPAAGFVSVGSAILIGLISGAFSNYAAHIVKTKFKLDDTLDVFACHGLGGTIGSLLTPVFSSKEVNPAGADGLIYGNVEPFIANLLGSAVVIAYSVVATVVIIKTVGVFAKFRVDESDEEMGLDTTQHGEIINSNFDEKFGTANRGPSSHGHGKRAA
jgi:Amt family ammonium transporter